MSILCDMIIIILLLSITLVTCCCGSILSTENVDRMALLALKDGFTLGSSPPDESHLNSWNTSLHICDWKGVICDLSRKKVTEIHLVKQNLKGIISPSIGNLSSLIHISLNNNSLHGEIPKQIGNLQMLQYLGLHFNSLQGKIPVELSNCSNLSKLGLYYNQLTGTIPRQLGSLTKITIFAVDRNSLVGEMPNFFRNFSSLAQLYIGFNKLHGEIRDSLQGLSKLKYLSLRGNTFTGTISSLYNISSFMTLELDENNFSGSLARDIDIAFPQLKWLSLSSNSFVGTIPKALCNISDLSLIQINNNMFSGRVPDNLGKLKNLWILNLDFNNLGGEDLSFINSLSNCTNLEQLGFSYNMFKGPLPTSIGNLSLNLRTLTVGKNYITGNIPEMVGELSGLTLFDIYDNLLIGNIPNSIGRLSNLAVLYLSGNKLHGKIPSSIGNLTNLLKLDLSANLLEGSIPRTFHNCKSMQIIDFSSNRLGGYVPSDVFSQLQNLYSCNLSHNSFGDTLILELSSLRALIILDVSYNNFIGEIPSQLGESLEFLSMARNSFQGNIPTSLGSLRGLNWLDLSNNKLSGPVIKELTSLEFLENLNLSFNQLEGEVPIFKNATKLSVVGNNHLCSGNPELHLAPCPDLEIKTISEKLIIIAATLSTFVFLLSLSVLLLFSFLYRRRKHRKEITADGLHEKLYRRVTYVELLRATEGFAESNLIGKGSFGEVFKGKLDGDNESKPVAVKVLKLGATKSFVAECKILKIIRHRNLLKVITSCSSSDHNGNDFKALVLEYMSNGNLDSWIHTDHHHQENARAPLTLAKRIEIAIDVGCALDYLHNNYGETPIVHCDLKPSNVLLDDDMVAHVGDFGLAKLLLPGGGESLSAAVLGTVGYVAPEYGIGGTMSSKGDVYSYGILLLELITGKRPTDEMFNNDMSLRSFVSERAIPDYVEETVVDQHIINEMHDYIAKQRNPEQIMKSEVLSILVSFIEVGISCSTESSNDRMDIESAIKCLKIIKEKYDSLLALLLLREGTAVARRTAQV